VTQPAGDDDRPTPQNDWGALNKEHGANLKTTRKFDDLLIEYAPPIWRHSAPQEQALHGAVPRG
jgi:hypothetical protein